MSVETVALVPVKRYTAMSSSAMFNCIKAVIWLGKRQCLKYINTISPGIPSLPNLKSSLVQDDFALTH